MIGKLEEVGRGLEIYIKKILENNFIIKTDANT